MTKPVAVVLTALSAVYLFLGPIPDLIPFVDEGVAFLIFIKSLGVLGLDLSRFIPGVKSSKTEPKESIDV